MRFTADSHINTQGQTMTTPTRSNWMLYGAYGSTGRLILDEALRRGHRPVLAGRDGAQLAALSRETGLSTVRLPLDDGAAHPLNAKFIRRHINIYSKTTMFESHKNSPDTNHM